MEELNLNPLLASLTATFTAFIDARIKAALDAQEKPCAEVDMDKLRELITPLVDSQVSDAVDAAMEAHTDNYDHDAYDAVVSQVDDLNLDALDDYVKRDALCDVVEETINDMTFRLSVR